ncbi:MAG: MFS transporter permease [Actinobacteria bacterium]|nr:MFS transporter permease [Actinomycetota bacterium]
MTSTGTSTAASPAAGTAARSVSSWWFPPTPISRIAIFRVLVYLYIPIDMFITGSWVRSHARLGPTLYQPLLIARLFHLPAPTTAYVTVLQFVVAAAAIVALSGRAPRMVGWLVPFLYLAWMLVAMSYGKVDHDRFAFLVALFVLPTVGAAGARDTCSSLRAGWALRCVQVSVVATYFLSACAKVRAGGWNWPTGATLELALIRRHTFLSTWLIDRPYLLVPMQFAMLGAELLSPLLLLARSDRAKSAVALVMWSFHIAVYAGVSIVFLPHCVAIASFVPLEQGWAALRGRAHGLADRTKGGPRLPGAQPDAAAAGHHNSDQPPLG